MPLKRLYCILLQLSILFTGFSQGFEVKQFGVSEGLIDGKVNAVNIDSLGRLIAFCNTGISVYNGHSFENYNFPQRTIPLPSSGIKIRRGNQIAIVENSGFILFQNNKIWREQFDDSLFWRITGNGGSTSEGSDIKTDDVNNYYFRSNSFWCLSSKVYHAVSHLVFRENNYRPLTDQNGHVYVQCRGKLFLLEESKVIDSVAMPNPNLNVGLIASNGNDICFSVRISETDRAIYHWNRIGSKLEELARVKGTVIKFLYKNKTWIVLGKDEILKFDLINGNVVHINKEDEELLDCTFYNDSLIAVLASNGLFLYDQRSEKPVARIPIGRKRAFFASLCVDNEDNLWVGNELGLFRIMPSNWTYFKEDGSRSNVMRYSYLDSRDNVYCSHWKDKDLLLSRIDPMGIKSEEILKLEKSLGFHIENLYSTNTAILFNTVGHVKWKEIVKYAGFFSTYIIRNEKVHKVGNVKYKFKPYDFQFENTIAQYKTDPTKINLTFSYNSFVFYEGKNFHCNTTGPYSIDGDLNVTQFLINNTGNESIYQLGYYDRLYIYKDELYYCDVNHLLKYRVESDEFELVCPLPNWLAKDESNLWHGQRNIYPAYGSEYLYFDSTGVVLKNLKTIGADKKLHLHSFNSVLNEDELVVDQTFMFYNVVYMTSNKGVFALEFSEKGIKGKKINVHLDQVIEKVKVFNDRIIFFSMEGMIVIDNRGRTGEHLFPAEVIGAPDFQRPDWLCVTDSIGNLIFDGGQGILKFKETKRKDLVKSNPVYLSKLIKAYNAGFEEILNADSLLQYGVKMHYKENISLYFAQSCMVDGSKALYKLKLQGFDEDWYIQKENFINYKSIPPGNYVLNIHACNGLGKWTEVPLKITIIVLPAWYQTTVMKIAFFVLLIIVIYLIIVWNGRRLTRKAELLQVRINEATIEIKEQKDQIERKQIEILDSIRYAKRIQQALMTGEKYIAKNLKRLMFPKD